MNEEDDCNCDDTEDLDLHRYQCVDCGKIFYYSNAAYEWHENGKSSGGIPGLG